jgi:hypothetical protein
LREIINSIFPDMRMIVSNFNEELRNITKSLFISDMLYLELNEEFIGKSVENFNDFKNNITSDIKNEINRISNQTQRFIDQANKLLENITSIPQSIIDDANVFKTNFLIDLKRFLKEKIIKETKKNLNMNGKTLLII